MLTLPSQFVLDSVLKDWLKEDVGRGDRTTDGLGELVHTEGRAIWRAKDYGVIAGLLIAKRGFELLDASVRFTSLAPDGTQCEPDMVVAEVTGSLAALLTGERLALNLAMRLSGIATLTRKFVEHIQDLPAQLVDTRKTTPGLRLLEKYATTVGGARNHRLGLDDAIMIKDNHIAAAGGIGAAIARIRQTMPYPLTIEVETESLDQVEEALAHNADIIMLDNLAIDTMRVAVERIRNHSASVKIEASGNVSLETIREIAATGVDFISSSAPITQSKWLDLSMTVL